MKATFKATNPDDMIYTMNLTMSLKQWRDLKASVDDKYPGWKFASAIGQLISDAEQEFYIDEPKDVSL